VPELHLLEFAHSASKEDRMSILSILSAGAVIGLVVVGLVIAVRSPYLPSSVHNSRLGWLTLGGYVGAVLAAYLVWGRSEEGFGIASILLGMPWSFVLAFTLSVFQLSFAQLAGGLGGLIGNVVLFGTVLLNAWIVYHLGARLPVLWTAAAPRAGR
jgi:hypothetical protein